MWGIPRVDVDTHGIQNVEAINVDLWYPRIEENYKKINISLMDVRAANDITISYDFDRDGWVIESDLTNPDLKEEQPNTLQEIAFIPAWPLKLDLSNEELLKEKLYGIYVRGCDDSSKFPPGFYYREAEETGLLAVYNAGLTVGRQEKTDD